MGTSPLDGLYVYKAGFVSHRGAHGRGDAALTMETSPAAWMSELRRCVTEYGFVGAMINPDPYEGTRQPPALGDRFWYPVWEALCELDVPGQIHSAGCRPPAR